MCYPVYNVRSRAMLLSGFVTLCIVCVTLCIVYITLCVTFLMFVYSVYSVWSRAMLLSGFVTLSSPTPVATTAVKHRLIRIQLGTKQTL